MARMPPPTNVQTFELNQLILTELRFVYIVAFIPGSCAVIARSSALDLCIMRCSAQRAVVFARLCVLVRLY